MTQKRQETWREIKRRETLARITEKALELFASDGFEATTLDAIAEAAGISRRTFFYYFRSKEEILGAWQAGLPEALHTAILQHPTDRPPLELLQCVLTSKMALFDPAQARIIDQIIRSDEKLWESNKTKYLRLEEAAFTAFCERWPAEERRTELQIVAMISVGALRLAIDIWAENGGKEPLKECVEDVFGKLRTTIDTT